MTMLKNLPCGRKRRADQTHSSSIHQDWKKPLSLYLKKEGLRSTRQRDQIAEVIFSKKTHFDIRTLIDEVRKRHSEISPATVYRSVRTLCDAELLNETLQAHNGVALYEAALSEHHDHLICLDCGEIFEFHDTNLEKAQNQAVKALGFTEVKHKHVVYANCEALKK